MGMFATSVTTIAGGHGPVVNASLMETPEIPERRHDNVKMLEGKALK